MASTSIPTKEVELESPNWLELPIDITKNILQRIPIVERVTSACLVCPLWWNIYKDTLMWRTIQITECYSFSYDLVKICSYAIKRSCGHLEDINIEFFGVVNLLKDISNCGKHLKYMRLRDQINFVGSKLSEACKKLPHLEELDLTFNTLLINKNDLKTIGQSCPLLKSLKLNSRYTGTLRGDNEAFVIAKTMSELRHLTIYGIILTDDGVRAILNGCPLLQSLYLGGSIRYDLSKSLRKMCHEQIKDLILPLEDSHKDSYFMFEDYLCEIHHY